MTKREAAIVSAYTGFLIGDFSTLHGYIEEILERPLFTHEMGSDEVRAEIREKSRADFVALSDTIC